jgi:hypothetical protein
MATEPVKSRFSENLQTEESTFMSQGPDGTSDQLSSLSL